jgi:small subunit ribosomal protein S21e
MQNDKGKIVDLYIPRKCSATGRLVNAKDHAAVQISICDVNEQGLMLPTSTTFCLSGKVRAEGEADDSINRLATQHGLLQGVWSYSQ